MSSDWIIYTDGASRGNPGEAAFSYVITRPDEPAFEHAERLPNTTNNQAEYTALVEALRKAVELGAKGLVRVHSDSELMVKQMRGEYRVRDEGLRDLYEEARELAAQLPGGVTYTHVRRNQNKRADELCNLVLDGKWKAADTAPEKAASPAPARPQTPLDREAIALLKRAMLPEEDGLPGQSAEQIWTSLRDLLQRHGISLDSPR